MIGEEVGFSTGVLNSSTHGGKCIIYRKKATLNNKLILTALFSLIFRTSPCYSAGYWTSRLEWRIQYIFGRNAFGVFQLVRF